MRYLYACQRLVRAGDKYGTISHTLPIFVGEGDDERFCTTALIDGPSSLVFSKNGRPSEVAACKSHDHTIWLQTEAEVHCKGTVERFDLDGPKPTIITICSRVARGTVETDNGPIVVATKSGQYCVDSLLDIEGPCRLVFDDLHPISGFCSCGQHHDHRSWIETEAKVVSH